MGTPFACTAAATDAWCDSIAIDDIVSVDFFKSESWLEDSTIIVTSSDGSELTLYASSEGGGDVRFVNAIRSAAKLDGVWPCVARGRSPFPRSCQSLRHF